MTDLGRPELLLAGFRVATMAPAGAILARGPNEFALWSQPPGDPAQPLAEPVTVGVGAGRITWVVPDRMVPGNMADVPRLEGRGELLTPGLIDCHTHLVHAGDRSGEWAARLAGASYADIARAGGGILSTVRATREASEDELVRLALPRLWRLASDGVTTVEIKSGYGLDTATELRMLRAARRLESLAPVRIVTTLLGAHAVPPEYAGRPDDYVRVVCEEMIPASRPWCSAVDVFCESIAFSPVQTETIFGAALATGLRIKVHAEQLSHSGAARLAARMGALSADHLEFLPDQECELLARAGTVATLLPGAFYGLRERQLPPVSALFAAGVDVAVATDSNPGSSPLASLLLAGNMACNLFGLTPEQAFAGMTRCAAKALGLDGETGTIEPGKSADFACWDARTVAEVLHRIGAGPLTRVMFRGQLRAIHSDPAGAA